MLDETAYGDMAAALRDFASGLGIGAMACLEGGYEPRALARSVSATIAAFTDPGRAAPEAPENEVAESHRRRLAGRWTLA